MDYTPYAPHGQTIGPWHDSFPYDSNDACSAEAIPSARPQSASDSSTTRVSSHLGRRRSHQRRNQGGGVVQERARERVRELEQRIRELESSASETTARATIKVLQTRVRDLEAEVDCLNMRLEQAELAMTRVRSDEPPVPSDLFHPMASASLSTQSSNIPESNHSYIASTQTQSYASQIQQNGMPLPPDMSTIPRSTSTIPVQPLISWSLPSSNRPASATTNAVTSPQRPMLAPQQTAVWRGVI